jgi:hypothetical protein
MITGLVSLDDASTSGSPTPKVLYMLDATAPGGGLMPHAPIVMTDVAYSPTPFGRTLISEGAAARYLRLSNGASLSFKEAEANLAVVKALSPLSYTENAPVATCPTPAESDSLYFLPRLSRVSLTSSGGHPTSGDYDTTYLNPQPGGPVAASLPINYGSLVSDFQTGLVWDFKDGAAGTNTTVTQVLAENVLWKFAIPGNTLTLQSNNGDLLQMTAVNNEIILTIANAPDPDGIQVLAGTATTINVKKLPVDDHFSLYYRFLTDKNATPFRPVINGVCQNFVVNTDKCVLSDFVQIPKPGNCPPPTPSQPAPPLVGSLNCGPDGMP